jgi:PTS system galactitol-specific IIA component
MTSSPSAFIIDESLTVVGLDGKDKGAVIECLANLLLKGEYVKESFLPNVLAREAIMPTGLQTKAGGVAIPHTDSEHVLRSGMAIGLLKSPVKFKNMANPSEEVDVHLVFLLAIAEKHAVVQVLAQLAEMFLNPDVLGQTFGKKDSKELAAYISTLLTGNPILE